MFSGNPMQIVGALEKTDCPRESEGLVSRLKFVDALFSERDGSKESIGKASRRAPGTSAKRAWGETCRELRGVGCGL